MVRTLDSESGLYDVELQRNAKAQVDGLWTWNKGNPYPHKKDILIYFAPLDISKVEKSQPKLAPLMVPQMYEDVVTEVRKALNETNAANGTAWDITTDPKKATVRVDMALVHFRPQRPLLRLISGIGGHFIKVPGVSDVVGYFSAGDICIEMTVRDGQSGQVFLACKDSNAAKAKLISGEAYSRSGNADVNLHHWAERLAMLVRVCAHDRMGDRTLLQFIEDRSWGKVLKERIMN